MWESFKQIFNVRLRRDNIKTTFEKNVDNYIKTEDIKGNLNMGRIRRHFSRPISKEIELYRSHVDFKLYIEDWKRMYKLQVESKNAKNYVESIGRFHVINKNLDKNEILMDQELRVAMINVKHARIYADTLGILEKIEILEDNEQIKKFVGKLLSKEYENPGISSMYIAKDTNIDRIVVPIVNPILDPIVDPIVNPILDPIVDPIVVENIDPLVVPLIVENIDPLVVPLLDPIVDPIVNPILDPIVDPIVVENTTIVESITGSKVSQIGLPVTLNKSNVLSENTTVVREMKKDVEVSSIITVEDTSMQTLYCNHFYRLIQKYNNFKAIQKKDLHNVYTNLKLNKTGILVFNKILKDGFNIIKTLDYAKKKEVFCIQNLAGIFKNNNKTIEFVLFSNMVINVPLKNLWYLENVINQYKNVKNQMVVMGQHVTVIATRKASANYFHNIKCIDGFYVKVDNLMSANVDKAIVHIQAIYKLLENYQLKYGNDILMLEKNILELTAKKFKLNLNNSLIFMALSHHTVMLQICCKKFLENNAHYWDLLYNWAKMIKEVKKTQDKMILANQSSNPKLGLHNAHTEIIKNVTIYDAFESKIAYFKHVFELSELYSKACHLFHINISKGSKIVKELKEFIDSGGSGDV